ncbi:GlsB/YeaQ/YmgE family stress response membrane protein [Nonomuraea sp. NPDC050404]|uniref:GlsB/YeaQ/YmgE family stress response membrane protein n=1 Tax=Nonomuraea sp. NPDC050404 TaxID=3155783 RepID=UPI0033DF110C
MEITGIISGLFIGIVIGALGRLVIPGRQRIPIWLTIVIGVVAALVGTVFAALLGVADTSGIDWIELAIQVGLAALGVSLTAGIYGGRGRKNRKHLNR